MMMLGSKMTRGSAWLMMAGSWVTVAACAGSPTEVEFEVIEEVVFDASLGIDLSLMTVTNNGIYWQDLTVGLGDVLEFGLSARVSFTGWLKDGTQFDTGEISYLMGNLDVIRGLEDGSLGMRVGGTRRIIIPPHLGYGAAGRDPIPPGAIMVFEIQLLEVS